MATFPSIEVSGGATNEEIAALTVLFGALAQAPPGAATRYPAGRSGGAQLRRAPLVPGPGAWQAALVWPLIPGTAPRQSLLRTLIGCAARPPLYPWQCSGSQPAEEAGYRGSPAGTSGRSCTASTRDAAR